MPTKNNGSGSNSKSALFASGFQDANKAKFFSVILLSIFEGKFKSVFKDKKSHKEVTKQKKSRFFLLFLLGNGRIRIQIHINNDRSGSGRLKNLDPDPQHRFVDSEKVEDKTTLTPVYHSYSVSNNNHTAMMMITVNVLFTGSGGYNALLRIRIRDPVPF
jgi:hypothetical protein